MRQTSQHNLKKAKKNIVLVGVAGVGKTTVGEIAAKKLNMAFVDMDMEFEAAEEADIDTLVDRYGDDGFNHQLLLRFEKQIRSKDHTIFAPSPRVLRYKEFWAIVKQNGISVHLQGKPSEIYMRQEMWLGKRKITQEEKSNERWKSEFNDYYAWEIRYCKKADHTVRIVGNKQVDAETLCKTIRQLIPVDDTQKEDVSN
jgi:shikimate kinase